MYKLSQFVMAGSSSYEVEFVRVLLPTCLTYTEWAKNPSLQHLFTCRKKEKTLDKVWLIGWLVGDLSPPALWICPRSSTLISHYHEWLQLACVIRLLFARNWTSSRVRKWRYMKKAKNLQGMLSLLFLRN